MFLVGPPRISRRCGTILGWALLSLCLSALMSPAPAKAQEQIPLSSFVRSEPFIGVSMTPNGDQVAIASMAGDHPEIRTMRLVEDTLNEEARYPLPPSLFGWVDWVDNTRLLVGYTLITLDKRENTTTVRKIALIDTVTQSTRILLSVPLNRAMANDSNDLLSPLLEDADHVLLSYPENLGFYPAVWKLNLDTGAVEVVEPARDSVDEWLADKNGTVRIGMGWGEDGMVLYLRKAIDSSWDKLHDHALFKDGNFTPVSFDLKGETLYVSSSMGKGRRAIYSFDLNTRVITSKIFQHPEYDAGSLLIDENGTILAATYVADRLELEFMDADFEALYRQMNDHLPGLTIFPLEIDKSRRFVLLLTNSDKSPDAIHLYDRETDVMVLVAQQNPDIEPWQMADVRRINYFARDGLKIPAYLTVPLGTEAKRLPTIIMPHGGPWVRDTQSYNNWAQFLASRGYAVLQPNFRGSTGFGLFFLAHGFGEWGKSMQDDLDDGAAWLVSEGISDPGRICIVGGSYGGYAALMGAITGGEIYQCAVAFASVADLPLYLDFLSDTPGAEGILERIVGNGGKRAARSVSPVHQAKKTAIPVLLAHGSHDIRVPYSHYLRMAKALKRMKSGHEFLSFEGGSHFLLIEQHRELFLARMEDFLDRHIGPGAGQWPDQSQ